MSLTVITSIPHTGSIGGGAPLLSVKVGGAQAPPAPPISPPLIMTCAVATQPCSLTSHLHSLPSLLFMDQASSLVLPWESSFRDGGPGRGFILLVQADYRYTCRYGTRKNHLHSQRNDLTIEID